MVFVAGRLRYLEADEVKAGIRRNIGDRRVRIANHTRVRRAGRMMAEASTLEAMFSAARRAAQISRIRLCDDRTRAPERRQRRMNRRLAGRLTSGLCAERKCATA